MDKEYFERLIMEKGKNYGYSGLFSSQEAYIDLDSICKIEMNDDNEDLILDAFEAAGLKFTDIFVPVAVLVTLDFYPQLRSKRKKVKKILIKESENIFESICELVEGYFRHTSDFVIKEDCDYKIDLNDIERFLQNSKLNYVFDDYDKWFKRKISFENVYVECFYAAVFIKKIHNLIISILYNCSPAMAGLPSDKRDYIHSQFAMDAWNVYYSISEVDQDELDFSSEIRNLEDYYDSENLLDSPGSEINGEANRRIKYGCTPGNEPDPSKVPLCCLQCKSYNNNTPTYILCTVTRLSQANSESFNCRAMEKRDGEVERWRSGEVVKN